MRIFNKYLLTLTLACCLLNVALAAAGQKNLDIYIVTNIAAYLVITLLYVSLNPKSNRSLGAVGVVLFGVFFFIAVFRALIFLVE